MSTMAAPTIEPQAEVNSSTWTALLNATSVWNLVSADLFQSVDWERFIADAEYHGVLPIVGERVLSSAVAHELDPVSKAQLRRACQGSLIRGLPLADEVSRVAEAFDREGIPIIPYKGPALAESLWGSAARRECADLDFLVERKNVSRADAILETLGYARVSPIPDNLRPALLKNASEEQFRHRETGLLLELQWFPAPSVFALRFDADSMWSRAKRTIFSGQHALSPSAEDLLILLSIHGWKHNWGRLIWVADIAQLIRTTDLDWEWLSGECKRNRNIRLLSLALRIANRVFGSEIAPAFSFEDSSLDFLVGELTNRMRDANQCGYQDWHRYMLLARDSDIDRARQLANFFLTPGLAEYKSCQLPAWASFGYRGVRLARLLRHGAVTEP